MHTKAARRQFAILNFAHILDHYLVLIFPTVALFLTKPWGISYAELLKLGSLGALAYGFSVIPAGWLADKIGRSKMVVVYFFGIGISSVSAGFTQSPTQLTIAICSIGVFAAIYHPVGIAMVYRLSDKPGRYLAWHGISGNLGISIAAVGTTTLAHYWGWQMAFIIPGCITLVAGCVYLITLRAGEPDSLEVSKQDDHKSNAKNLVVIFLCIAVVSICGGLSSNAIINGLPKILTHFDRFQSYSLNHIGSLASGILLLVSLSQFIIGEMLVRVRAEKLLLWVVVIQFVTLLALNVWQHSLILLALILFTTLAQITINDVLIGERSHDSWRSTIYSLKYTVFFLITAVAYWLVAISLEHNGHFTLMYQVLVGVTFISVIFSFCVYWFSQSLKAKNIG